MRKKKESQGEGGGQGGSGQPLPAKAARTSGTKVVRILLTANSCRDGLFIV